MEVYLRTERLLLREFTPADADELYALHNDPAVMRYLDGGNRTGRDVIEREVLPETLATYRRYPGFGRWATLDRATGRFLGWLSVRPSDGRGAAEPGLGWRLHRAAWGHGYATEGARALVHRAFTELGARRVWAQTMAVNRASRRVMEKTGLRYVRTFHEHFDDPLPGTEYGEVEYAADRAGWLADHPTPAAS